MNIAKKIKDLRIKKGYSQDELAKVLKVSVTAIRNYENEKEPRIPEAKILFDMANFFNVSMEYLIDDNCNNFTFENVEINKILHLNDNAIERIKLLTNSDDFYIEAINDLCDETSFVNLLRHYYIHKKLSLLNYIKETFIPILEYDNKKKSFFYNIFECENILFPYEQKEIKKINIKGNYYQQTYCYLNTEYLFLYLKTIKVYMSTLLSYLNNETIFDFEEHPLFKDIIKSDEFTIKQKQLKELEESIKNNNDDKTFALLNEIFDWIYEKNSFIEDFIDLEKVRINANVGFLLEYNYDDISNLINKLE